MKAGNPTRTSAGEGCRVSRSASAVADAGPDGDLLRTLPDRVLRAAERLRPWLRETPFEAAPALRPVAGQAVRWKLECFQATGSFKARGALNRLLVLREEAGPAVLSDGVITASSGNHGRATAYALSLLGGRGIVYLPESVADSKRRALEERYGDVVELRLVGEDAIEAELAARAEADRTGRPFISPYNDPEIVAGQGVVGLEMDRVLGDARLDAVLVPVGGGGLIAGIAAWLRRARPEIRIVGCQPRASAVMAASVRVGRVLGSGDEVPFEPTLADGVAGGVEPGAITLELCRQLVDEWVLVEEPAIAAAMRFVHRARFAAVEGSAALPVAALGELDPAPESAGLVLSGAGISAAGLRLLAEADPG